MNKVDEHPHLIANTGKGELDAMRERIQKVSKSETTITIENIFELFRRQTHGIPTIDPHMEDTPNRWLKAMLELTEGYETDPSEHLLKVFPNDEGYDELIISKDIPFTSLCAHHILPFYGFAHVAYIPDYHILADDSIESSPVVGLSKLARVVEGYSKRFQVQERLTMQIHDAILNRLKPRGVAVILEATHTCQALRGVKKPGVMVTSKMSGVFREKDNLARLELLNLIKTKL